VRPNLLKCLYVLIDHIVGLAAKERQEDVLVDGASSIKLGGPGRFQL
jgi:hypothetical protein